MALKETAVNTRSKGSAKVLAEEPSRREALRRIGSGLVTALLAWMGLQKSAQGQGSDTRDEMRRCVLCGKPQEQVAKLILGLHGGVCVECVDLCNDVIKGEIDRAHRY
jgi:ClpX C4-type zinc finger